MISGVSFVIGRKVIGPLRLTRTVEVRSPAVSVPSVLVKRFGIPGISRRGERDGPAKALILAINSSRNAWAEVNSDVVDGLVT